MFDVGEGLKERRVSQIKLNCWQYANRESRDRNLVTCDQGCGVGVVFF